MHPQDYDHERMEGLPLVSGPSFLPGVLGLQFGMDREQKEEVRKRERKKDVGNTKRLKSEQKLNRNPKRKSDSLSMEKASRHRTSPATAPAVPSSSGV